MRPPGLTVAYVADESRLHHLLASIASWRRFDTWALAVVDIGLSASGRSRVVRVARGPVNFYPAAAVASLSLQGVPDAHRARAFEQKALVGTHVVGDPIVFLDADILAVHPSFIEDLGKVGSGEMRAARSAWDADFTWTYTAASLPELRRIIGRPDFKADDPVCNSGVWAMRADTASQVAPVWHQMYRAAVGSPALRETIRPGTAIGDQEFLLPACATMGVSWVCLPGAFNMQVHERLMPWVVGPGGHLLGGHREGPMEVVRGVHYGCEPDGTPRLDATMIACAAVREWLQGQYASVWTEVREVLGLWEAAS